MDSSQPHGGTHHRDSRACGGPIVTYLLTQFVTWTALLVQTAQNLLIFPIAAIALMALLSGAVFILRLICR